jgi:nicotinamide mononucleotide adenylyltransferase
MQNMKLKHKKLGFADMVTDHKPEYGLLGTIARFKPLHLGAAAMLDEMCSRANKVIIGIGSANKYNERNPFTAQETEGMLHAYLAPKYDNYNIVKIPDFAQDPAYANGDRWKEYMIDVFCKQNAVDGFLCENDYVIQLLKNDMPIIRTLKFIPQEKQHHIRATQVRSAMALDQNWQQYVPQEIAAYITNNHLDIRYKEEFGMKNIRSLQTTYSRESAIEESLHAKET